MRTLIAGFLFWGFTTLPDAAWSAEKPPFDPAALEKIDAEIAAAIERKEIPGAVLWFEREGKHFTKAYGNRRVEPNTEAMTTDTVFDLASLTKVVATAPAILKLIEQGKVALDAPVQRYIPEFRGGGRESITVKMLLTHVSGLPPGIPRDPAWKGRATGIRLACTIPLKNPVGQKFVYSDVNFILLGEIVERCSGVTLDWFLRREVYGPLRMNQTCFVPGAGLRRRIAPTTKEGADFLCGVVHDPTSRLMGGVTGHAGGFSTAENLSRYARMILAGGIGADGRRVFKKESLDLMTKSHTAESLSVKRGLGWDIDSGYSEPRGQHFSKGASFGHTGWTGTSIWIDPPHQAFVILLTNRNHPTEKGKTKELRFKVATLAAEAMGITTPEAPPAGEPEPPGARGENGPGISKNGVDLPEALAALKGLRLGLITNHTGRTAAGQSTIDLLHGRKDFQLVALFSPEHGIRGQSEAANIADSKDAKTGLPVYSLYGKRKKPSEAQLKGLDALVFDIQDIGCRFYTYISTMKNCLEAAAGKGLRFIVLDRVNPIGGVKFDGPLPAEESFTACHAIPIVHGMTTGELARMMVAEEGWNVPLTVISPRNWPRSAFFDQTGLPWVNPSPNMRSLDAALVYPGVCLLEFCNVSVGRGTETPFLVLGAPWIDGKKLAAEVAAANLPGIEIAAHHFTPTASVFAKQVCQGLKLRLIDREKFVPLDLGLTVISALHKLHPGEFEIDKVNKLLSHPPTLKALKQGASTADIRRLWSEDLAAFAKRRAKFISAE